MSLKKAISVDQLLNTKFRTLEFTGEWLEHIGIPESSGVWIMWGDSGNGKTYYSLQMAKMFANLYLKVAYDSLEEGASLTLQRAMITLNMRQVARRFVLLDREPMDQLMERLRRPKSPQVVFIDSFQYAGMTKKEYLKLKEEFGNKKLIIFLSHNEGKHPEGKVAKFVRFDADVKIRVEGYVAHATSRFGGTKPYVISAERAEKYHGDNLKTNPKK